MHDQEFTCNQERKASRRTVRCGYLAMTWHVPVPGRAGGPWCRVEALLSAGNHPHHEALALRHRRIPEEYEPADPQEATVPGEEDAPEQGEPAEKEAIQPPLTPERI